MDYSLPRLKKTFKSLSPLKSLKFKPLNILQPLQTWIEGIPVENPRTAHRIVSLIPADCPFERDLTFFGRVVGHIPPMCKINPLYDQLVMLRFKAMCYLADECGEDISAYC